MIEKKYKVWCERTAESAQVVEAYSFRKAAVAFVEKEVNIEPNEVVHVEFGTEFQKFIASELVLKDGWKLVESEEVPAEEVTENVVQASVDPRSALSRKGLLRMESAYSTLRGAINILTVLAYISVFVTSAISMAGAIEVKSIGLMLTTLLGAAVSVLVIYVLKHLLHAFLDIADAHIRKID